MWNDFTFLKSSSTIGNGVNRIKMKFSSFGNLSSLGATKNRIDLKVSFVG